MPLQGFPYVFRLASLLPPSAFVIFGMRPVRDQAIANYRGLIFLYHIRDAACSRSGDRELQGISYLMAAIIGYRCANLSSFSRPTICIQSYPWLRRGGKKREVNFGQNMSNTGICETGASLHTFRVVFIEHSCSDKHPVQLTFKQTFSVNDTMRKSEAVRG